MPTRTLSVLVACILCLWSYASEATTTFNFALYGPATTSAGVFTTQGVLVRTLWRGTQMSAGTYSETWDDLDDHGNPVRCKPHDAHRMMP